MSELALPPPDATPLTLFRDYHHVLSLRLFVNEVQTSAPRALGDYQEPTFAGYHPSAPVAWNVTPLHDAGTAMELSATVRWRLSQTLQAPLIIRGWFCTALYADDFLEPIGEHFASGPLIIGPKRGFIVARVRLVLHPVPDTEQYLLTTHTNGFLFAEGGGQLLVRGNERRQLQKLVKAIQAVKARDARWPNRSPRSRMADVVFYPDGEPSNHNDKLEDVLNRAQSLLLEE